MPSTRAEPSLQNEAMTDSIVGLGIGSAGDGTNGGGAAGCATGAGCCGGEVDDDDDDDDAEAGVTPSKGLANGKLNGSVMTTSDALADEGVM